MNLNTLRFFIIAIIVFSLLLMTGCGGDGEQSENGNQSNNNARQGGEDSQGNNQQGRGNRGGGPGGDRAQLEQGVPVRIVEVGIGPITDGILSTSVVEAEQSVEVYSRVTGTVTKLNAEEGQYISAGSLLCSLEDEELKLAESKARAEMDKLQRDLERTETLLQKGIATETDLNNAKYQYEQAEIGWRQAKTNLEYTQIKSTINGIVSDRQVRLGQKVDPSVQLYSLFNPRSLVINVRIPENDYFAKISNRTKSVVALVSSESLPGKEFTGSIKRVAPVVDPQTNTIKITLQYSDPGNILRPGMYVRVKLVTDTRDSAILVPKSALLFDANRQYVFIIKDEKAVKIQLDAGFEDTSFIESRSQIVAGDKVVVVGQNGLKDGTKVRIVNDENETTAESTE